ncbi:MAG: serine/threonine protein kinase [Thioploca sp.]|nr:serine/threonine protein kinase [Thioploca sp.]
MMKTPKFSSRYQYQEKYFEGGQGTIYLCQDTYLDRLVAIKYLKGEPDHLQKEATALSKVCSKHVVEVYDFITEGSETAIVEEYISGDDLTKFHEQQLTSDEYLKTLYQIASGIADIHVAGYIHRDIKPANIKLSDEGIIKILDFGLSSHSHNARTTNLRGTMPYIAPELLQNYPPVRYTKKVDTFAFGITAWVLAKGSPSDDIISPFETLPFRLHAEVIYLLKKACSHDLSERPNMCRVRDTLARQLLHNQHIALLTYEGETYHIFSENPSANIGNDSLGRISIEYDGFYFKVSGVSGDVYLNNREVKNNERIPDSCVITLGHPIHKWNRIFITFDVSHPEVVL